MKKKFLLLILLLIFILQPSLNELNSWPLQVKKDQEALKHEVTVTLKLVQVYVTDKRGNPVTDLTQDDFVLYDNGKLQTITDFEKHLLIRPEKKIEEEIAITKLPQPGDVSSLVNRKFFLFLDIDRNNTAGIVKSKKAALHFIDTQLQPTDEVGVFSYSFIVGFNVHQYLTSDHDKARKAIERIREVPGIRPVDAMGTSSAPMKRGEGETAANIVPDNTMSFLPPPTVQGGEMTAKASSFINIMKELAKALRYIEGYKNIILFSRGIQYGLLFSRDQALRENYEEMSKELATANTPVHTVNTAPIDVPKMYREPVLKMLSELSGGKYFNNVDYYEEVSEQIQNITGNYYVLGYYIDDKWDGKYRKIKVEVKRKGCIVQSQQGYFNPKPFGELSDFEKQLHLIDLALGKGEYYKAPSPFPVAVLPCLVEDKPGLILLSEIFVDDIEEVIGKETEIVTLIFDEEHNIVDSTQGKANLTDVPQKLLHHYVISTLKPGHYECRIILRNLETGRSALGQSPVTVPEVQPSEVTIYSPFILIPNTPCFYLKALKEEKEKKKKPVQTISLNDIYPFLASNHSPLVREIDGDVRRLLTVLKFKAKDLSDSDIDILVDLVLQPTEEWIPLQYHILDFMEIGNERAFLVELLLPNMDPGQYTLEFFVVHDSEVAASVIRAFEVR